MKHYAWFIKKKKTFLCSDQIWGTLRVDQSTSFFLDNAVGKVKATVLSKKKYSMQNLRN